MAFPALLDTCVLFPQYLNDTLLTQADAGLFRPLWSGGILAELGRVLERETEMTLEQVEHRLGRMRAAFLDAEVTGYEHLVDGMTNHAKDRHVLAAAVRANVEVIVTDNVKDFPDEALKTFDIQAVTADNFLLDQLDLYPADTIDCLHQQVGRYTYIDGPLDVADLLGALGNAGAIQFAAEARRQLF